MGAAIYSFHPFTLVRLKLDSFVFALQHLLQMTQPAHLIAVWRLGFPANLPFHPLLRLL
ncbi:hypothetical protein PHET_10691 [Paragonimus heterotremus]|uniref:Uncharacterized protein n=1 Tax=Paragonimus heterotremus TaxID=100268 RepID=A0A8J4T1Y2_9TREM|nr:hypothetical protein PHET_10691 [Paragonimus heterotremus]